MNKKLLLPALLIPLLVGMLVWLLLWQPEAPHSSHTLEARLQPQGGDFQLQGKDGAVTLKQFRGQVVALYFGYTWCPDICPTSLAALSAALNALPAAQQQQIQALFVSVDPERDSLPRLEQYAAYFHPRIQGVTGDPEALRQAAERYGAAYRREPTDKENYAVDHSADLYLIDRQGRLRQTLPHGTEPQQILTELRGLLGE
jgi:protein SCO1/2